MMAEGVADDDGVVLGLDTAAWAFSPADQTSPALAAQAGALFDTQTGEHVTELRIHGVSGSDGPTMLEHPTALQVAGDRITGFYRRWTPDGAGRPSIGWKLEAYSWGGLTERPLASASWLVLAPFMIYNLAHFMLPAEPERELEQPELESELELESALMPSWRYQLARGVLRLLALAATVQFVTAVATVTVSTVGWQAAGRAGVLPQWMSWYVHLAPGWRVAIALLSVGAVVALLWVISVRTANRYEARTSNQIRRWRSRWPLTEPGFWNGALLVSRQRVIHAAAALAAAALLVAYRAGDPAWAHRLVLVFSAVVLAVAAVLLALPLSDRHNVSIVGNPDEQARIGGWWWVLLAAGVVALLGSAAVSGWTDQSTGPQSGMFPGMSGFLLWLLIAQLALLLVFGVAVAVLRRRAPDAGEGFAPYLGGHLATLVALLAFLLGGLLTAALNLAVAGLLGTAVPGRLVLPAAPPNALYVPWPVYAFGAAALGMLAGALIAGLVLYRRYRGNWKLFNSLASADPTADPRVSCDYGSDATAVAPKNSKKVAKAWAVGRLADDAARAVAWLVGGGLLFLLLVEAFTLVAAVEAKRLPTTVGLLHEIAAIVSFVTVALAIWLVGMLRSAYSSPSKRKTIGALWDVATFWPRAVHPFAPPCYAERAIPEVVDRVRLLMGPNAPGQALPGQRQLADRYQLTVPCGPLLLTGYSQGSIIAPAVAAQLPPEVLTRPDFALLTLACPARRLYGRAFPAYFGRRHLEELRDALTHDGREHWRNAVRRTDYIGSWIFSPPAPLWTHEYLEEQFDQLCWDPVVLAPDAEPTPPPVHRHSGWWPDPRASALGAYLVDLLGGESTHYVYSAAHGNGEAGPASGSEQPVSQVSPSRKPGPKSRRPAPDLTERSKPSRRGARTRRDARSRRSLVGYVSGGLLALGRWRRQRAHHDTTAFANAGPPSATRIREIISGIPSEPPPNSRKLAEHAGYAAADRLSETELAWLWTLALDAAVRSEIRPLIKNVKAATYGFVESHSGTQLAAIFYVGAPALAQAAPLFVTLGNQKFPVVIRPSPKHIKMHANVGFDDGQVTCAARIGDDYGVLTAAHVVGGRRHGRLRRDMLTVAEGDLVRCSKSMSSSNCEHKIIAMDGIMDAALIAADIEPEEYEVASVRGKPFWDDIIIHSPEGEVTLPVIEQYVIQGVIPVGARDEGPPRPALLFCKDVGAPGWSGSLADDAETGKIACMYQGVSDFHTGQIARLQMLRQIEMVWGAEMLRPRDQ
jgi:hypothetical protein